MDLGIVFLLAATVFLNFLILWQYSRHFREEPSLTILNGIDLESLRREENMLVFQDYSWLADLALVGIADAFAIAIILLLGEAYILGALSLIPLALIACSCMRSKRNMYCEAYLFSHSGFEKRSVSGDVLAVGSVASWKDVRLIALSFSGPIENDDIPSGIRIVWTEGQISIEKGYANFEHLCRFLLSLGLQDRMDEHTRKRIEKWSRLSVSMKVSVPGEHGRNE
jgi:hypothetical protein